MSRIASILVDNANVDKAALRNYLGEIETGIHGVLATGALGSAASFRSDAQIEIQNSTGGHALFSILNWDKTEEGAITWGGVLSDSSIYQHIGMFVRFPNSINTVGAWNTVWGIHAVGSGYDSTTILTYDNNSVWLATGPTGALPWNTIPVANSVSTGSGTSSNAGLQIVNGVVSGWCGIGAQALTMSVLNYNILIKNDGSLNLNAKTGKSIVQCNNNSPVTETSSFGFRAFDGLGFYMANWPTTAASANAHVANADYVRLVSSLRSIKHDIQPITMEDARRTVMSMEAVLYRSRVDADQRQWAGFIADDVEVINPVLTTYDQDHGLQSVAYDRVPSYLVPVIQDHESRIAKLEMRP